MCIVVSKAITSEVMADPVQGTLARRITSRVIVVT
jgi:hypothetical protein